MLEVLEDVADRFLELDGLAIFEQAEFDELGRVASVLVTFRLPQRQHAEA